MMPISLRSVIVAMAACASCASALQAQLPPSVELRVAMQPTVAKGDSGPFLAWELHIASMAPNPLTITRVDVLPESGDVPLHTIADSALIRDIHRPGPIMPADRRRTLEGGTSGILYIWLPLTGDAPSAVRHRVTLRQDTVEHVLTSTPVPVAPPGPAVGPPLRGTWVAANGPSNLSGHRRLVLALNGRLASAQRFGIDYLAIGEDGNFVKAGGTANEDYHGYGTDVLAVADGIVVETKDGIPENTGGPASRAVPIDLHTVSGNSVVLDIGDGRYAFYAHLIPGSLRVREGERVRRGQVIGLVGNSGNSTAPHLHFHIVDGLAPGTSTLGAEGLPYAMDSFEVLGRCSSFMTGGCPRSEPVTVRAGIPLQNQIIRFPD